MCQSKATTGEVSGERVEWEGCFFYFSLLCVHTLTHLSYPLSYLRQSAAVMACVSTGDATQI